VKLKSVLIPNKTSRPIILMSAWRIMNTKFRLGILLLLFSATSLFSQDENIFKKHFIGSSLLLLTNFSSLHPDYYQINYGYRFTSKDAILIDFITWKMSSPLGMPLGSTEEKYPGYIRESGIDIGYQRTLWKGLNTSIHVKPLVLNYLNKDNEIIQNGFQLFTSIRFGYKFYMFKCRMFIEPTLAFNYWPVTTNEPESFKIIEKRWPNYLFFDPNIIIAINF
jgi:hypothetical protein